MERNCIILANGSFPKREESLELLRSADYICCCDGAVEKLLEVGLRPNVIVGDGDSIPQSLKERFANIFIRINEQDNNDLTKATRHCRALGFRRIIYLGATGLREDHTIGNIFLLPYYMDHFGIDAQMITDNGVFRAYNSKAEIATFPGQQISIFNISCSQLNGNCLRYPLAPFAQLWQGTLNEATAEKVNIKGDGIFLVFQNFETRNVMS